MTNKKYELSDLDREALADKIQQGYTSGRLDFEDENMQTIKIAWKLKVNAWIEE